MNRVNSSYMTILRKMINNGFKRENVSEDNFSYVLSHEEVLKICKTENIIDYIQRQQVKYLAHIARRSNSFFIKRLLFPDVKVTKRGRRIMTLEDYVLSHLQMTADQFYKKALSKTLNVTSTGSHSTVG